MFFSWTTIFLSVQLQAAGTPEQLKDNDAVVEVVVIISLFYFPSFTMQNFAHILGKAPKKSGVQNFVATLHIKDKILEVQFWTQSFLDLIPISLMALPLFSVGFIVCVCNDDSTT